MARNQSAIVNWAQYLGLRSLSGFMHCFDIEQNLHTAAAVGDAFHRLMPGRVRRAEANIAASFPTWDGARVRETARRSMRYMFQLFMVDAVAMPRLITRGSWMRYVSVGDVGPALDRILHGDPAILLTAHCGNWELTGFLLSVLGYPVAALARPLDNPLLDRWLVGIREARGMRIITKFGAAPVMRQLVESGSRIGFIADQNAGDQGLFVPFFGRLASSYKSIGLLAIAYDIPIVAGHAVRRGERFDYELRCTDTIEPADWADQPDPLFYVTARYNLAMEAMIRRAPEQYLWLHRRWKSRPKHERRGQPMPRRLIAKLEQLPWMTPEELDGIVERSNEAAARVAAAAG